MSDLIERQAAIDAIIRNTCNTQRAIEAIKALPKPFHNTTMSEVLRYIDDMPEDVWQEFTACLECRGWVLERKTAKWCGGDFA